ncbi:hypothetical protein [Streptomyces malaysiensis]|uniref:hypothetical protein n=1 Tax=Streptomyces malaysiensis TaxID=92644 RepID=UPI003D9F7EB6
MRGSPTDAATPRTEAARAAVPAGSPSGAEITWSATMPARRWRAPAWSSLVCMKTRVEAKAMASTIGVIAEARRRALARLLAEAGWAGAGPARSGRPISHAHRRAMSGPSRATASMNSITTPRAALAASSPEAEAATPVMTMPPARAATPSTVRMTPGRSRSTAASPSARPGGIRAGRRAASRPARSEVRRPAPTATTSGIQETESSTGPGMAPFSSSGPNHQRARA